MATLTNSGSAQALRGQGVKVSVSASDQSKLAALTVGATVTAASGKTGQIYRIDSFGSSFIVTPTSPVGLFDSTSTPGILAATEVITY